MGPGSGDPSGDPITELPRPLTAAEVEAIDASNAFGFELLQEVTGEDRTATVFLSPLSASMALGMALNGADDTTFDAMRQTLGFEGLSEADINESYRDLLELLIDLDPGVEVAVGNSVWHRQGLALQQSFRDRVEEYFDARVQALDFGDAASADVINQWVSDVTRDRIQEMITPPIPANMAAYLMNAVYFKAGWTEPFDPDLTRDGPFHLPDGSTETVELMIRDDTLRSHTTERYAAADLPYAGQAFS
ncbi:MAG: serpin family protein, partial [bacterium]